MKTIKRIFAFILCVTIVLSGTIIANAESTEYENEYPFIFVHGMFGWGRDEGINKIAPYWGGTTGSIIDYLENNNIEAYDVSVGPISSAWDNACEIYAQLTGTTVDYGEAHSEAHGHNRYGRTYTTPLVPDWSADKKVHLIGHSHGGQAVRLLAHLLTYGDKDEINATDKDSVSDLFTGGKEYLVESVTTICSPNNGSTAYNVVEKLNMIHFMEIVATYSAGIIGRTFLNGTLLDFHLEHYGLTLAPGEKKTDEKFGVATERFLNSADGTTIDLSIEGAKELNDKIEISKNINYFCYSYDATNKSEKLMTNTDFPLLAIFGTLLLMYGNPDDSANENWIANDGLVNTVSAKNPFDEPARDFDGKIEKGIWNVMPTRTGDHGTPIGLLSSKKEVHAFYDELTEMLISLEK